MISPCGPGTRHVAGRGRGRRSKPGTSPGYLWKADTDFYWHAGNASTNQLLHQDAAVCFSRACNGHVELHNRRLLVPVWVAPVCGWKHKTFYIYTVLLN